MKKVFFFLVSIFFMALSAARAGAVRDVAAGSTITTAQTGAEKSSDAGRKQKKQTGEKGLPLKKRPMAANADKRKQKKPEKKKVAKTTLVPPTPVAPAPATLIASWNVEFSWKGSPGMSSYRLQVSSKPTFTSTVLDETTPSKSYTATAVLAPGVYYWRVKTVSAKKSSRWSRVRKFKIPVMAPSNLTADNFINKGDGLTEVSDITLAISAASYVGISAYYASENPDPPDPEESKWVLVTPPTSLLSATIPFKLSSSDGGKNISVWFKDTADRLSTAATGTITLDTTPPIALITSQPSGTTDLTPVSFGFTASKPRVTFQCKLDSGSYEACTPPIIYKGLTEGNHTFSVKAISTVTNLESEPVSYTWTAIRPLVTTMPSDFINNKGNRYLITGKTVMLSLSAVATTGQKVTGYFASESPDTPEASDPGWVMFTPVTTFSKKVPFTVSDGNGVKTIYVWYIDTAGNISEATSNSIRYFSAKYMLFIFLLLQAAFLIS